ncbi:TniQ family protein [Cyanobacteria bacterium FACHB-DQ100]|nr:TniQ family protein [Cyanobacteria bacterium FACHB-DQ100]
MRSGIMASTVQPPEWLRFCPLCVQEDTQNFGECYWHRLHQLPGVEVCPDHNVRLLDSEVRVQNPQIRHEFVSAEQRIQLPQSRSFSLLNSHHRILLKIAQDATWLLQQTASPPGLDILLKRYRQLLTEQGLATYSGRVRVSEVLRDFRQFYPNNLLQSLQCGIDSESQHSWLFRLVRSPKGSQHPLRHLLLMQFLGHTAESFFQLPHQFKPFGEGPWMCLNRVADHFQQNVIYRCEITYSRENGKPIGTFRCSCGFTYARTGPDKSEEDQFRISKIRAFGPIWEQVLKALWQDSSISLRGIARQLGVDAATVKLHAAALELKFPRQAKRQSNRMKRRLSDAQTRETVSPKLPFKSYRTEWLIIRTEHPDAGRSALRKQFRRVYTWLQRNDSEWLEAHLPPRLQKTIPVIRVDWENRDAELAEAVEVAVRHLQEKLGKPKRITIAAIARELGQLAVIQKHLHKLPLTAQILNQKTETREAFALRRIEWVRECYEKEQICLQRWQVGRRAGLRPDVEALPAVQDALTAVVENLYQKQASAWGHLRTGRFNQEKKLRSGG